MNRISAGSLSNLAYLAWDYLFDMEHHLSQIIADYENILPPITDMEWYQNG